jgi:hypothetical protein
LWTTSSLPRRRYVVKALQAIVVALAAAVTLTSVAAGGPEATRQRVGIMTKGVANTSRPAQFVLSPLQVGSLRQDSGIARSVGSLPPERVVIREGQRVSIYDPIVETIEGKRGTLTIRSRIEYVDAGNGYHVGTGTWKVVRGTGQYAGITGGGRRGDVYLDRGPWSGNNEGFLTLS